MRSVTHQFIASALLALTLPAFAGTTLLDFESVPAATTDMTVGNPYAAQGISFTKNAWSIASKIAQSEPGDGNFFRGLDANGKSLTRGALHLTLNPNAPAGNTSPDFLMNVAEGFDTDFSMLYAASMSGGGQVSIYSGLDGQGDELGTFDLIKGAPCELKVGWLCNWTKAGVDFAGVAHSIRFTGDDGQFFFDDIRMQRNNAVPEPSSVALSLAALGALVWSRKRSAR